MALGAAFLAIAAANAASSSVYGVFKDHIYLQTSSSAPAPFGGFPYSFSVQGGGTGALHTPLGASVTLPQSVANNNGDLLDVGFSSESSLLALYPNGTYQLELTGTPTLTYSVTSGYPLSVPQITNGTWQNGVLVIDPAISATLNFSTFSDYSSGVGGHMDIQIQSQDSTGNVNLQQQYATVNVGGGTTVSATPFTSYVIPAGTLTSGGIYQATLSFDSIGSLDTTSVAGGISVSVFTNNLAAFIVGKSTPAPAAPTISSSLANQTGPLGGSATFSPNATFGSGGQPNNTIWIWTVNGQEINFDGVKYELGPGGTLTINDIKNSDVGTYQVVVVTGGGLAMSIPATLAIGSGTPGTPPTITTQPFPQTIASGGTVTFHVVASGAIAYQWLFNGNPLPVGNGVSNAAGATLVINGATSANAGNYSCSVSNSNGSTVSNAASLSVSLTSNIGRLINISCRAGVGTGGNILIAGYVIGGQGTSGTLPILVRASGPALVPFGVGGTLPDPELKLYSASTQLATNTGWAGSTQISAAASAVGAFSWGSGPTNDSAIYSTPSAGAYTAQISGAASDTGVALVELYDATPVGTYTPSNPRLVNISARVQVGTGGNILIAGFVIGGATSKTVLVRASGPALAGFGVAGTLPDPQLQLYSGSTLLATNNGWGGKTEIANTAASVGAFNWANPSSRDSALLVTLPPGAYTAQVSGASNDTGVALVELYEVP